MSLFSDCADFVQFTVLCLFSVTADFVLFTVLCLFSVTADFVLFTLLCLCSVTVPILCCSQCYVTVPILCCSQSYVFVQWLCRFCAVPFRTWSTSWKGSPPASLWRTHLAPSDGYVSQPAVSSSCATCYELSTFLQPTPLWTVLAYEYSAIRQTGSFMLLDGWVHWAHICLCRHLQLCQTGRFSQQTYVCLVLTYSAIWRMEEE